MLIGCGVCVDHRDQKLAVIGGCNPVFRHHEADVDADHDADIDADADVDADADADADDR